MVIPSNQLQAFNQATAVALGRASVAPTQAQTAAPVSLLSGVSPLTPQTTASTLGIQSLTGLQPENYGMHYGYNTNSGYNIGQNQNNGNFGGQFGQGQFGQGQFGMMNSLFGMMSGMLDMMMMMFQNINGIHSAAGDQQHIGGFPQNPFPGTGSFFPSQPAQVLPTPVNNTPVPTPTPAAAPTPAPTPAVTPIQPTDINITMIESVSNEHNSEVLNVLKSQVDQSDINVQTTKVADTVNTPKNLNELKAFISNDYVEPLNVATSNLQTLVNSNDPSNRVVNMSFGRTALFTMNFAKDALKANPNLLTEMGLPAGSDLNSLEVNKALLNLTTTELSNNATVQKALQNYQNVASQAAQKGIFITVAGGNDQATYKQLVSQGLNVDPAWSMNNLAFSSNVIVTGAIDTKGTTATGDDSLTSFGSMGSQKLHPTLAANGVSVNGDANLNGTSFSSPQVAAAAQKVLEINSKLSPEQVKNLLLSTASYSIGGMPVLDTNKAIAEAKRLAALG